MPRTDRMKDIGGKGYDTPKSIVSAEKSLELERHLKWDWGMAQPGCNTPFIRREPPFLLPCLLQCCTEVWDRGIGGGL